jgi:CopG family nickel-responsive transcriptional regulator
MTAKGKNIEIISVSMSKKMAKEIDELSKEIGYSTRSELIRDAIRLLINSKININKTKGRVEGVIVVLYKHSADKYVSEAKHKNMDIIKSFMHSDFGEMAPRCCDTLIFSGNADRVRKIIYELKAITNVDIVHVFIA